LNYEVWSMHPIWKNTHESQFPTTQILKDKIEKNNYTKELKKNKRMRTKFEIKIIMRDQPRILNWRVELKRKIKFIKRSKTKKYQNKKNKDHI